MGAINIDQVAADIVEALRGELTQVFNSTASFARSQARHLAAQAALIAEGRITGEIDDSLLRFFDTQLRVMARNFARAMAMRALITLQRAWNAIVGVVWGALNGALGSAGLGALPIPASPPA